MAVGAQAVAVERRNGSRLMVRFATVSGHFSLSVALPLCAIGDIGAAYSITSSARASNVDGTVKAKRHGVLRLIANKPC
jgi:hypothetical protein